MKYTFVPISKAKLASGNIIYETKDASKTIYYDHGTEEYYLYDINGVWRGVIMRGVKKLNGTLPYDPFTFVTKYNILDWFNFKWGSIKGKTPINLDDHPLAYPDIM